jgi:hypothetical protein
MAVQRFDPCARAKPPRTDAKKKRNKSCGSGLLLLRLLLLLLLLEHVLHDLLLLHEESADNADTKHMLRLGRVGFQSRLAADLTPRASIRSRMGNGKWAKATEAIASIVTDSDSGIANRV